MNLLNVLLHRPCCLAWWGLLYLVRDLILPKPQIRPYFVPSADLAARTWPRGLLFYRYAPTPPLLCALQAPARFCCALQPADVPLHGRQHPGAPAISANTV